LSPISAIAYAIGGITEHDGGDLEARRVAHALLSMLCICAPHTAHKQLDSDPSRPIVDAYTATFAIATSWVLAVNAHRRQRCYL
jgi:hypothetical protein